MLRSRASSASDRCKFTIKKPRAKTCVKQPCSQAEESVHDILVPVQNIKIYPKVLKKNDLRRVQTASRIVSKEERQRKAETIEAERQRLEWESEQRKRFLQEIDKARDKTKNKQSALPYEEDNTAKILDRVSLARQEEAEEVKRANRIILATKCHIVRDAQINEKREINRELREKELLLEKQILDDCKKTLEEQKRREQLKAENEQYAAELRKQLEKRELNKYLEARRIEEEAEARQRANIALAEDAMNRDRAKQERIAQLQNEFRQCREISNYYKKLAFEEQRLAEMKAQEYMRQRYEREKELQHQRRLAREQKQREADRLLALQTKFLQMKNHQEEMSMRQIQEQKEREFRQKEIEATKKRKELEEQVMRTRQAQIEEMRRIRAITLEQERNEHERILREKQEVEMKEMAEKQRLHELKEKYRKEIITQIDQKQLRKRETQLKWQCEFGMMQKEEEKRQQDIRNAIIAKVQAMRESKIPEKFVRDVERQLNLRDN